MEDLMSNIKGRFIMNDYRNKVYTVVGEFIDLIEENIYTPKDSSNKLYPDDIIEIVSSRIRTWYGENWEKCLDTSTDQYQKFCRERNTDNMRLQHLIYKVNRDTIKELQSHIYENNYRKAIQILCDLFDYSEEIDVFFDAFIKEKNASKIEGKNSTPKSTTEPEKKVSELQDTIKKLSANYTKLETEFNRYRFLFAVMNSPIIVSNNRIKFNSRYRNLDKLLDANLVMLEQYTENECAQLINILTSNYRKNKKAYISKDNYYMEFQIPAEYFEV